MSVSQMVAAGPVTIQGRGWDSLQFRLIFAVAFPFFLAGSAGGRLVPRRERRAERRSILAEACKGAGTIAQMAFAG